MKRLLAIFCVCLLTGSLLYATRIVSVRPLTNRILVVHFDDGFVEYPGYGESRNNTRITDNPLDTEAAVRRELYTLTSSDDEHYRLKKHPVVAGRKSKPTEFTRIWPPIQPVVFDHWIYLELPEPMQRGKNYTLDVQVSVEGENSFTFEYDEFTQRSDAIHVNQVGYIRGRARKVAYISHWMGDMGPLNLDAYENNLYYVVDLKDNQPVYVGKMKKVKDFETGSPETKQVHETPRGQYHASDVFACDFTPCPSSGEFILVIEGVGHSFPFSIEQDAYREAFVTACRGLFHERAGIDKIMPWSKWNHLADHNGAKGYPLYYTGYRFMDSRSEAGDRKLAEKHEKDRIKTWGWYHDAGDWDGYPTHMVVPSYLMTVYELAPENFSDGELNIPGSGNGIPDILDEASWLLKYFRRTRHVAMQQGFATGGVAGARVHGDYWKKEEGLPSWEDTRKWYLFGEESVASFRYAGQAAQLAYCLEMAGRSDSAETWVKEATEVFQWALNNTRSGDPVQSARFFAAAWLYKLTGEEAYHEQFTRDNPVDSPLMMMPYLNRNWTAWGVWAYATLDEEKARPHLQQSMKELATWWADTLNVSPSRMRAFRYGNAWGHPMVVGQATTPKVFPSVVAHALTGDEKYMETVIHTCNYMLGGNPLNMCWVTGLGDQSPKEIMHIDSWLDRHDEPVEGQVPYGPNRAGNRGGEGFNGPWDSDLLRAIVYPETSLWPGHELWSENRWCPITNEYTVHQNISVAAAVYGYLCGPAE